uniref:SMODS and SLOG-associating 2TM effector domain-containing protein n=1 Tax=viral metagenome TaxID=1070528 RepID=A0A6C0J5G5_9ZZZZ
MSNNKWTEKKSNKLVADADISKIHSLCHTRAYEYYRKRFERITKLTIVLSSISTILAGVNILLEEKHIGVGVASLIFTVLTTAIAQHTNSEDPSKIAAGHEEMSKGYNKIILKIESELVNDPLDRLPGTDFIRSITNTMTDLSTGGQKLPTFIWDQIQKELHAGNLDPSAFWSHQNIEVKDIQDTTINIITESPGEDTNTTQIISDLPSVEIRTNPKGSKNGKLLHEFHLTRHRFG